MFRPGRRPAMLTSRAGRRLEPILGLLTFSRWPRWLRSPEPGPARPFSAASASLLGLSVGPVLRLGALWLKCSPWDRGE